MRELVLLRQAQKAEVMVCPSRCAIPWSAADVARNFEKCRNFEQPQSPVRHRSLQLDMRRCFRSFFNHLSTPLLLHHATLIVLHRASQYTQDIRQRSHLEHALLEPAACNTKRCHSYQVGRSLTTSSLEAIFAVSIFFFVVFGKPTYAQAQAQTKATEETE